jgi:hypothetical protein
MSDAVTLPEPPPMDAPAPPPPAADAAPRRGRGRPKGATDKAPRKTATAQKRASTASLEKRLGGSLTTLGTFACLASPADGMVLIEGAPNLAAALSKLADENPKVKSNLERMLTAGAWSGVIAAVLPMAVSIAANHGMLPAPVAAMLRGQAAAAPPRDGSASAPN